MDPLKPFGTIVRSVWDKTVRRTESKTKTFSTTPTADQSQLAGVAESPAVQPLHARVHARIAQITHWDASQARQIFVESVLLSELGDGVANDPSFTDVVRKISWQLGSDNQLSARLDTLLKEMSSKPFAK